MQKVNESKVGYENRSLNILYMYSADDDLPIKEDNLQWLLHNFKASVKNFL